MLISIPVAYEDTDEKHTVIINAFQVTEIREYEEKSNRCVVVMANDERGDSYIGAMNRFEMAEWINAEVLKLVREEY